MRAPVIAAIIGLAASSQGSAADAIIGQPRTVSLFQEASFKGESVEAFVLRIAYRISKETDRINAEVCAVIVNDNDRHIVDVRTSKRLTSCDVPKGDFITVHSHPRIATPEFSASDYETPGYLVHGRNVYFQDGPGTGRFIGRASKSRYVEHQKSGIVVDDRIKD
ncbi:hypothetical protein G6F31_012223 [Rhizopus arrhizus]|nr:hypothetical protein G6F31_012223 [Rhizopus arrhizus]